METLLIGLLVKPLVAVFFVFWMALGVWLVQRYAPPKLKSLLLRKLW